jgi:hypothetical protein
MNCEEAYKKEREEHLREVTIRRHIESERDKLHHENYGLKMKVEQLEKALKETGFMDVFERKFNKVLPDVDIASKLKMRGSTTDEVEEEPKEKTKSNYVLLAVIVLLFVALACWKKNRS